MCFRWFDLCSNLCPDATRLRKRGPVTELHKRHGKMPRIPGRWSLEPSCSDLVEINFRSQQKVRCCSGEDLCKSSVQSKCCTNETLLWCSCQGRAPKRRRKTRGNRVQLMAAGGRTSPKDPQKIKDSDGRVEEHWRIEYCSCRREEEEKRKRNGERGRKRLNSAAWIWSHEYVSFWYLMSCSCTLSLASWNHNIPDISWLGEEQGWGLGREATKKWRLDKKDENRWEKYGNITWNIQNITYFIWNLLKYHIIRNKHMKHLGAFHVAIALMQDSEEVQNSATPLRCDAMQRSAMWSTQGEPCWTMLNQSEAEADRTGALMMIELLWITIATINRIIVAIINYHCYHCFCCGFL